MVNEELVQIVLEDLLGIEDANRLADLCGSYDIPIQGMLQAMVEQTPMKPALDLRSAIWNKIERDFSAIKAMSERRNRIMREIVGILFPTIAPRLELEERERISKLLGDFETKEDRETERTIAELPALLKAAED